MLPFTLSFLDDVVPDNYRLPVTASVSGGDAAAPTIYRPLYKDWEIQKFVNSNRLGRLSARTARKSWSRRRRRAGTRIWTI